MTSRRSFLFGMLATPVVATAAPIENLLLSPAPTSAELVAMVRNLVYQMYQDSVYSANRPAQMVITDPVLASALGFERREINSLSWDWRT